MTAAPNPDLKVRTRPVQRRSQERVDKLLDAAAAIIEERGVNGLSTSEVAERAGSSVGVVYRYFPNIDSLLLALAARNLKRFGTHLAARLHQQPPRDWRAYVRLNVDAYAELARTEPGLAVVRFGDIVAMRFPDRQSTNDELIGRLMDVSVADFGFHRTEEFEFAVTAAIEVADALTRRAFLKDREGDRRFVDLAIAMIEEILTPFEPREPV